MQRIAGAMKYNDNFMKRDHPIAVSKIIAAFENSAMVTFSLVLHLRRLSTCNDE